MYRIVRIYDDKQIPCETVRRRVTLKEAMNHMSDPEARSSSATSAAARRRTKKRGPWYETYTEDSRKRYVRATSFEGCP